MIRTNPTMQRMAAMPAAARVRPVMFTNGWLDGVPSLAGIVTGSQEHIGLTAKYSARHLGRPST